MIEDLPKNWGVIKLNEVLYYEQPTNYIVESTKYSNSYQTPVLTAGKTFILGYTNEENGIYNNLPCIIFDDFTTESKFVDFAFKVKSSAMKILTNNKFTNLKFLYYSMQTIECIADTHKRFWISDYSNKPIYLPPLAEQERIVQKIEELFAQVDKIEEEKQSLLKLIDRAKEKVLDLAMKGKLVKQDPNDESASVLLEKIFEEKKKLAKEGKIKLSKDELLPPQVSDDNDYYQDLPNFVNVKLRDVCFFINGFAFKSKEFIQNGINIIRISDLIDGNISINKCVKIREKSIFDNFIIHKGDLCIAMSGATTGKIGIYNHEEKAYINQRVGVVRVMSENILLPEYRDLFFDYKKDEILKNAYGGAQPNISSNKIMAMHLYLPSIKYQLKIVQIYDKLLDKINQIKDSL